MDRGLTVLDCATGLEWEKKTDDGGLHDKDNTYSWSTGTDDPDGTAFTVFLEQLNNCFGESTDGHSLTFELLADSSVEPLVDYVEKNLQAGFEVACPLIRFHLAVLDLGAIFIALCLCRCCTHDGYDKPLYL